MFVAMPYWDLERLLERKYSVRELEALAPAYAALLRGKALTFGAAAEAAARERAAGIRARGGVEEARLRSEAWKAAAREEAGARREATKAQLQAARWEWGPGGVREREVKLQERGADLLEEYLKGMLGGEGGADEVVEILRRRKRRKGGAAAPSVEVEPYFLYE